MKKKFILILLLLSIMLTNTSCWSRREIEELGFVMGLGIAKTDNGHYSVIAQIANPNIIVTDNPDPKNVYTILKAEGITIFDAVRNISLLAARRLYVAHLKTIIIDESVAKEGIAQAIGFLVQDMEVRLESEVFVSKVSPEIIFDTPNTLGEISAAALMAAADIFGANNKIYVSDLHRTVEAVNNPVINYVTTLVEKKPPPSKNERELLELTQIAVFDDDKLKGYLNYEEGQAFNFITGNFKNGLITFQSDTNGDLITIEVVEAKTAVTPLLMDEKVGFDIHVKVRGNVAERISQLGKYDELDIEKLQKQMGQVIENGLRRAIYSAQNDFKIDYYNLSKYFSKDYPREFKELNSEWNEVFSTAHIRVHVESTVIHSALNVNKGRI